MKNLFCILLLAVMLVLVIAQYACADEEKVAPILYRFDGRDEAGQWAEMLGFKKTLRNIVVRENYDYLTDILREYQPDFFCAYTEEQSPRELCQAGLIEAFTPTEAMRREISEMAPYVQTVFRNELMIQDGQLLGYPIAGYNVCEAPIFIGYWIPDAWQASPFRNMTPPSSFAELLDFIEVFLDTPHDGFRLFYSPRGKDDYLEALIREPLEQAWIVQSLYAGRPVVFSDPQFITLANRAQMLGQRLMKEDYATKRSSKTRYLIADRQQYGYRKLSSRKTCRGPSAYNAERLNDAVDAEVRKHLTQLGSISEEDLLKAACTQNADLYEVAYRQAEEEFQKASRQVTALEEETVKALTGESQLDLSVVNGMLLKHRAKLEECQRAMEEAKAKKEAEAENEKAAKAQVKEMLTWVERYDKATVEAKHMIITALVDRIEIGENYEVHIQFKVSAEQFIRQTA